MANTSVLFNKEQAAVYNIDRGPIPITIQTPAGSPSFNIPLFLTNFEGGTNVNHQINYAFNNETYVYIFGERLSVIGVNGIAFTEQVCSGDQENRGMESFTPKQFIDFYNKYKLRVTSGTESLSPLKFVISNMTFEGYFIALKVNLMYQRESFFDFNLTMLGRVLT